MRIKVRFAVNPKAASYTYEADGDIQIGDKVEVAISMGGVYWKRKIGTVVALESNWPGHAVKIIRKIETI